MSSAVTGNVFITGSATGIGAAVTERLARQGCTVYAGVHRHTLGPDRSSRVIPVPIDVTDPDSVSAAAEQVTAQAGAAGLQVLINNAGIIVQGPLELVPPALWRRQFEVNTFGPVYVTQSFLPLLRAGTGRVINISAPTARVPVPFLAPIAASKAALSSLSDSLRLELAAWRIPVVVVEPGGTETEIFAKADQSAQQALANTDPARVELYESRLAAVARATERMKLGPIDGVAAAIVKVVNARTPKRHYTTGKGVRAFGLLAHLPTPLRERAVRAAFGLS